MSSPLPISKRQFELLGRRLVDQDTPAWSDLVRLHDCLEVYGDAMTDVADRIKGDLGLSLTARVKNTGTILEKLQRNQGRGLSSIHDLAGLRVVGAIGRFEQDRTVDAIDAIFGNEAKRAKIIDRRESPSHGYRAVHVIVYRAGIPVEIQVRTAWQHQWAELFEKLADQLGRSIRYGAPPDEWRAPIDWDRLDAEAGDRAPSLRASYERARGSRSAAVRDMSERSERIDEIEREIEHLRVTRPRESDELATAIGDEIRAIFNSMERLFDTEREIEAFFRSLAREYPSVESE